MPPRLIEWEKVDRYDPAYDPGAKFLRSRTMGNGLGIHEVE